MNMKEISIDDIELKGHRERETKTLIGSDIVRTYSYSLMHDHCPIDHL
jgi:hypothetical protein